MDLKVNKFQRRYIYPSKQLAAQGHNQLMQLLGQLISVDNQIVVFNNICPESAADIMQINEKTVGYIIMAEFGILGVANTMTSLPDFEEKAKVVIVPVITN